MENLRAVLPVLLCKLDIGVVNTALRLGRGKMGCSRQEHSTSIASLSNLESTSIISRLLHGEELFPFRLTGNLKAHPVLSDQALKPATRYLYVKRPACGG